MSVRTMFVIDVDAACDVNPCMKVLDSEALPPTLALFPFA